MLLLMAMCPAMFFFSCGNNAKATGGPEDKDVKEYTVLTLAPRDAILNTDYPASIQGQQDIEIRPKVDGFVEKIFVDEGSLVARGGKIIRPMAAGF